MKDRVGFYAGCADAMSEMCCFYLVAAFVMSDRWGHHIGWFLLATAVCSIVLSLFLRKTRPVPALAAVAAVLFGAALTVFICMSRTPMTVGYVVFLVVGAAVAMGCPLNYVLKRPVLMKHLGRLDVMLLALLMVVLCREALEIASSTILCILAVVLLDCAAVIGLRMTEGAADTKNALKASMVALSGAVAMVGVIAVLVAVLSRSGGITGAVLGWLKNAGRTIGTAIQRVMEWLASRIHVEDVYAEPSAIEVAMMTEQEQIAIWKELSVNPVVLAVIAGALVVITLLRLVYYLRKNRIQRGSKTVAGSSNGLVRRGGGGLKKLWAAWMEKLRFRRKAFLRRNTPGGILIYLERRAKLCRRPRKTGESMGAFVRRMDPDGGLDRLADALDREYYGAQSINLSARECRQTRRYIRKVVQHG